MAEPRDALARDEDLKAIFDAVNTGRMDRSRAVNEAVRLAREARDRADQAEAEVGRWMAGTEHAVWQGMEAERERDVARAQVREREAEHHVSVTNLMAEIGRQERMAQRAEHALAHQSNEIEQILGKALGYPWYKDDGKSWPEATEADGVCVGDHDAASLAMEAIGRIVTAEAELATLRGAVEKVYSESWLAYGGVRSVPGTHLDRLRALAATDAES